MANNEREEFVKQTKRSVLGDLTNPLRFIYKVSKTTWSVRVRIPAHGQAPMTIRTITTADLDYAKAQRDAYEVEALEAKQLGIDRKIKQLTNGQYEIRVTVSVKGKRTYLAKKAMCLKEARRIRDALELEAKRLNAA